MELEHLRSFLALAGQLHFARTARLLNVSQPALTKRIRQLESEIGGQLFHRGRNGTRLTDLGGLLRIEAGKLVLLADQLLEEAFIMLSLERSPTFREHGLRLCAKYGSRPGLCRKLTNCQPCLRSPVPEPGSRSFPSLHAEPVSVEFECIQFRTRRHFGPSEPLGEKVKTVFW